MQVDIPIPWIRGTEPGRSCSRSFGSFTKEADTEHFKSRPAKATSSILIAIRFSKAGPTKTKRSREIPHVADGILFNVLSNLLILDGERLSYRTLDVEQIGSVYETMMGFDLEVSTGRSIAIKPAKSHGAPSTINLEELLARKPSDRAKWFAEKTDQKLTGQAADRPQRRPRASMIFSRPWRKRSPRK